MIHASPGRDSREGTTSVQNVIPSSVDSELHVVLGEIIFASSLVVKIVPDTNSMLQFPLATAVNTFQCFMRFQQQSCISHILGVTNILDIHVTPRSQGLYNWAVRRFNNIPWMRPP